jgi:hypothetical protein
MRSLAAIFVEGVSTRRMLLWLGIASAFILSFALYFVPEIYAATGGLRPIDTQIPITPEIIFDNLAKYPPEAIRVYGWFLLVDCFYPASLAAFIAYFWSWTIRYCDAERLRHYALKGFVLLPFAGAALDVCENIGFWMIISAWPQQELWDIAKISTGFRQAKLSVQIADILITLGMLGLLLQTFIRRRFP